MLDARVDEAFARVDKASTKVRPAADFGKNVIRIKSRDDRRVSSLFTREQFSI